ncbi:MAG TPA: hypothetical protein VL484_15030 [Vicinamibacterales bacterium]|jgi:hypothetical protein|nr:hypothetical protein [Vicinamibacterales bacterium]
MNRVFRFFAIIVPAVALGAAPLLADVKTHDTASVKFEGFLGRMMGMFGGKAAKEGIESTVAVKGNRKATINDMTGRIVDLSEEKVYDLDMRKKTYTVTTFDELRRRMREAEERAAKENEKEQPSQPEAQQKPQKEYEVDFDVKDTGQKKQLAGYDTHEVIATVTVREKGRTLEDGGGIVMTSNMWLGPEIPQLKELTDFEMRYWKQLQEGAGTETITPEQMAMVLGSFPGIKRAMERFSQEGDKLKGTALDTTTTFESVKSKEQLAQSQQQQGSGGGISGMLAKKMIKHDEPKARSTVFTTHHAYLSIDKSVDASDLAIPPDFKEKK